MEKQLKIIIGNGPHDCTVFVDDIKIQLIKKIEFIALAGEDETKREVNITLLNLIGDTIDEWNNAKGLKKDLIEDLILLQNIPNVKLDVIPYEFCSKYPLNLKEFYKYINLKAFS